MSNIDADAFNIALVTQLAKVTLYSYKNMGLSAEDVVSLTQILHLDRWTE